MVQRRWYIFLPWLALLNGVEGVRAQKELASSVSQGFEMANCFKKARTSVVSVQTFVNKPKQGYCRVGSGFIYDEDGFVITRGSVINGGDSIVVTLTDGRQGTAQVIYNDEVTEVALLRLPITR